MSVHEFLLFNKYFTKLKLKLLQRFGDNLLHFTCLEITRHIFTLLCLGSVQVLHQRVGGWWGWGLTELADALRGGGGSQVKIADVILEQIF